MASLIRKAKNLQPVDAAQVAITKLYLDEIQNQSQKEFEHGKLIKSKYEHLRKVEFAVAAVSIVAVTLQIFEYFFEIGENIQGTTDTMNAGQLATYNSSKTTALVFLYILFVTSLLLALLTVYRYIVNLQYMKLRGRVVESANLITSGVIYALVVEVFFVMLIPYPWLQGVSYKTTTLYGNLAITYHVNAIIQFFSALRFIVVLRSILTLTYWSGDRAQRICDMFGSTPSIFFTLRCLMRANPSRFIFFAYLLSIPYFGYMLMIAEGPTLSLPDDSMKFTFANSLWNVIITASTIGYGDYYARTLLGRSLIFIVSLWGTTIISIMVVAVTNLFLMTEGQEKSYWLLKRIKLRSEMETAAAKAVVTFYRLKNDTFKHGRVNITFVERYKKAMAEFKTIRRYYIDIADYAVKEDEMRITLDNLQDRIKHLEARNKILLETNMLLMNAHGVDTEWQRVAIEKMKSPENKQGKSQIQL